MLGKIAALGAAILISGILLQAPVKAQPPVLIADLVGARNAQPHSTKGCICRGKVGRSAA
jgi:hypothetical protein